MVTEASRGSWPHWSNIVARVLIKGECPIDTFSAAHLNLLPKRRMAPAERELILTTFMYSSIAAAILSLER